MGFTLQAFLEHAEAMDARKTRRWYAWVYVWTMYLSGFLCVLLIFGTNWWVRDGNFGQQCVY